MKHSETDSGRSGIQVIERAANVLRAMKDNQTGMSLGQIAAVVNLPRSTVQRIVGALQKERFVIADISGSGFRLGPELGALAEATRYNIVEQCRILLTELTLATGETSDLSVMRGDTMIFLDQVPGTHRLRTVSYVGEVFPITPTANGRACLALMPREQALSLAKKEWSRKSIKPDMIPFNNILDEIIAKGLAFDINEHTDGICAVGFAFQDIAGDLHAISVPVPSSRFVRERSKIEKAILATKIHLEKMIHKQAEY